MIYLPRNGCPQNRITRTLAMEGKLRDTRRVLERFEERSESEFVILNLNFHGIINPLPLNRIPARSPLPENRRIAVRSIRNPYDQPGIIQIHGRENVLYVLGNKLYRRYVGRKFLEFLAFARNSNVTRYTPLYIYIHPPLSQDSVP